jgi:predicted metalloendopeptidase
MAALLAVVLVPAVASAPAAASKSGLVPGYRDTTCSPCRDFYRYANGAWLDTVRIPPAYGGVGAGREIADRNQEALRRALEHAAESARAPGADADTRKLGILYTTLMDSARADREGLEPLAAELERIRGIRTQADVIAWITEMHRRGGFTPFTLQAEADLKSSGWIAAYMGQGGIGLPERDYYFRGDSASLVLQAAYREFAARLLQRAGLAAADAAAAADRIYALEKTLAGASKTAVELRDTEKMYNKTTVSDLQKRVPAIGWVEFFRTIGVPTLAHPESTVILAQPEYMQAMGAQLASTPPSTWREYFLFHQVRGAAGWLDDELFRENFAFQSRLTGARAPLPRWKRVSQAVDFAMGEALGKAYVAENFGPEAKRKMNELVDNLFAAYRARIQNLPWMGEATRARALEKLSTIQRKIGYPDRWRDYSSLAVEASAPGVHNLRAAFQFEHRRGLAKIGRPKDRSEWEMSPATVNAYYNPLVNEIVFPAGILQRPMFDPAADDAVNYGGIGMVIGHEITHGFDDEGRKFDAAGNLREWWTKEDAERFEARAKQVVEQYSGYVGVDTVKVNGELTLGENIADLGGITIAYHAYRLSLKGKPAPVLDGYSGDQRFFMGVAQAWRRKIRDQSMLTQIRTDPHSPPYWRVNGPLSNVEEFARAFGCRAGDPMVRNERIAIW